MSVNINPKPTQPLKSSTPGKAVKKGAKAQRKRAGDGYQRSRMNALTHGLAARVAVLPGEDRQAYEQLRQEFHDEWDLQGPTATGLVDQLVENVWKRERHARLEIACHRRAIIGKYTQLVSPVVDDMLELDVTTQFLTPLDQKEPEAVFEQLFGMNMLDASPSALKELHDTMRGLLSQKFDDPRMIYLLKMKMPRGFQLLWEMALERPRSFSQFLHLHELPPVRVGPPGWASFSNWVENFALPYIRLFEGPHTVSREYRNHVVQLANLDAMKELDGFSRYEVQLWNKYKEILAMLMKLREQQRKESTV